ncbi:uncharacterized protein LOC119459130 isoform X4 [Dermacentor silvarum]|uniref:uncharacterized protein LOC119459130 isoform X4 n=1 Tax=Dermacentor silvarum TaxID=543639 RepID=UPI0021017A4F|nr:uncharacterized protein LOC119459130 isoform X4 [Dermacentor silvarum]
MCGRVAVLSVHVFLRFAMYSAQILQKSGGEARFLSSKQEGTSITEKLEELPLTPTVIALGSIFSKQCFVTCDHEVLFSQALSFTEATCLMFLCYYVFNITYAEEGSTTLEFLQRLLFHIQPSTGTKAQGKKSRTSVHNKIMSLARKLQVKC